ncbi:SHOCT domain-containing protein [Gemmata sp. JC717]|uniref:SHOCT domain-containing protein n=1 Tax=Gemmata algarum TaxID=2975278 RepID=A0ABU5F2G4_9BACT|nr:SHOCT domain-containing protein [Gemmata algarum]MDY3552416.1 SHOCT domain-containing protein [Gemmata algarum]MDY3561530.1 SHOCT domain-containing protein [Gemmata algarum]
MSIADELKKLEGLRWNGTLTESEFAQAKAAILAQLTPVPESGAADEKLGEHLAAVRYQNELERIDREWEQEREQYMTTGKDGSRHVPTAGDGLVTASFTGVFGALWTILAFSIMDFESNFGPPLVIRIVFPLFGAVFAAFGIWAGIQTAQKAEAYTQAHAAYQRRRAALNPDSFR